MFEYDPGNWNGEYRSPTRKFEYGEKFTYDSKVYTFDEQLSLDKTHDFWATDSEGKWFKFTYYGSTDTIKLNGR